MPKRPAIRVALDLETTGLHPEQDTIIEIAAIKFQDEQVIDRFETFVSPGRSLPYRVQRLTGIRPETLLGAPSFASLSRALQTFLGDYPIVGHSIPFDVGFLRMRGIARSNPLVDTFELATVLLPSLVSYNLGQVALALGITVPDDRHRAMVDTVLAMDVFLALHQHLQAVDLAVLNDLAHLDAPNSWPLLHFFRQELRDRQERDGVETLSRGSLGDRFAAQLGMDPRVLSFAVGQPKTEQQEQHSDDGTSQLLPGDEVLTTSSVAVALPQIQSDQTVRAAVRDSLQQHTSLLLELTTGKHDYASVLLPACEWLVEKDEQGEKQRLVIACVNQQAARHLMSDVLPQVQQQLHQQFAVAYLAEQGGYLCTHRWFGAAMRRTSGELTAEQARGLAKLRLWTHQTLTGERGELNLLQQELSAWERISSGYERLTSDPRFGSSYERCTYRRKGYCFVSLAEERVKAAQIVVTTHAGLLHDLVQPSSLLKTISSRILLDADLLEDENTRWGSEEFQRVKLLRLLDSIGSELEDGRYQGLLALAAPSLRENGAGGLSTTQTIAKRDVDVRMQRWFQQLRQARAAVERLFGSFTLLFEEYTQQGTSSGGKDKSEAVRRGRGGERIDQPLRLNGQMRHMSAWSETESAWQQFAQRMQAIIDLTGEIEKTILSRQRDRQRLNVGSGEDSSVAAEFVAIGQQLREQKQMGEQALSLGESNSVYWLRMPLPPPPSQQQNNHSAPRQQEQWPTLYGQVIQVANMLNRFSPQEQTGMLFCGTALSVDGSFAFMAHRLGLEQGTYSSLSITSDHCEQTLLYMPNDVSEPNAPQYQRNLDEAITNLATMLDGQVVVLFTSHSSLRSTYATIKPVLEARNILVLGQGMDGSPRQLWQVFQDQERVVLLGTGSFWDGLDDIVRLPACLVIARLPMPVLNDPPIAARAEQSSDQLHQFTVPTAALRLRRMLNRLAWSDQKRNAVILFDRRIVSKEYGPTILHSLPHCSQRQGTASHLAENVLDWLTGTGTWEDETQ